MGQRLGQHFLKNKRAVEKIVDEINPGPGELIVEIGPGKGALTFDILNATKSSGADFLAIERDEELAKVLAKKLAIELVVKDALTALAGVISEAKIGESGYKIVGNIPYYITGKLLRTIGELGPLPKKTILMIQREVAQRVSAKAGRMNLLAASVQVWAEVRILFTLSASDFTPPPKVNSAVIVLEPRENIAENLEDYYRFIKQLFSQPRKTILNNLPVDKEVAKEALVAIGLNAKSRPQDLSVEQIFSLQKILDI